MHVRQYISIATVFEFPWISSILKLPMANFFFNETLHFIINLLNFMCIIFERKWSWLMAYVHTVHVLITPNADLLQSAESIPVTAGTNDLQFQMIKLISVLTRFEEAWLSQHTQIVSIDIFQGQWTMPMSWLFLAQGWWWQSSENAFIWQNIKMFFSRTTGPIVTKFA